VILVDTSVWVDHLRAGDAGLRGLLEAGMVLMHPFVLGEIALGQLRQRAMVLTALGNLSRAVVATEAEVMRLIEAEGLAGSGIGYLDAHLLAAARLSGARVWTRDRRLAAAATRLGIVYPA